MTENQQVIDRKSTESMLALAGYLAVHHHQNNLAMMFNNPSVKVRLLLSYVLIGLRQKINILTQCAFYRSVISQCHLQFQEVVELYTRGELSDDMAERMVAIYEKKATLAHDQLMELTNASD